MKNNNVEAVINNLKVSPKKLNFLMNQIRMKPVEAAQRELEFSKVRISKDVKKCLESAIANAEHNAGMDISKLIVTRVDVGKSLVLKRFRARARGRGAKILRPFSFLRIVLSEKESRSN